MSRHPTPDILSQLMGEIKQEDHKAIKQPLEKKNPKPLGFDEALDSISIEEPVEFKEKATFNLPVNLLKKLEDRWMEIRRLSGSKQISKTLLVEKAIELAFEEFDVKKQASKLYGKLASNKAIKRVL